MKMRVDDVASGIWRALEVGAHGPAAGPHLPLRAGRHSGQAQLMLLATSPNTGQSPFLELNGIIL